MAPTLLPLLMDMAYSEQPSAAAAAAAAGTRTPMHHLPDCRMRPLVQALHTTTAPGGASPWRVSVFGTEVSSPQDGGSPHAVLCFAAHCGAQQPGAGDLVLHWGCSDGAGDKWRQPPPGWHTSPPQSNDAGEEEGGTHMHASASSTTPLWGGVRLAVLFPPCSEPP
jgi:hypothetical protein